MAEQERIGGLLAAARDERRSGALVLGGEAGIGKSALLDWAEGRAGNARVLRATGFEAESSLAFAGLLQLLWPVRDRLDGLPEPRAAALRTALGLEGGGGREQDRFAAGLAVLTLLADLAEDGPVLCLVDDVQWLDAPSTETLLFVARRLGAEGVVMLFASRDEGWAGGGLPEARLGRLVPADAEKLLAGQEGVASSLREWLVRESAGNPLALIAFGASARRPPGSAGPLPLPERVTAAFAGQIAAMPEATRTMLLIAAAEGRSHLPTTLGAAEAMGVGLADLEEAERADLVVASGSELTFRHPLIRIAAYQSATAAQRMEAHRVLSDAATDPDCKIRHRASATTGPDEDVAAGLEWAAERARERSGYVPAASLYRQAADLTPGAAARSRRYAAAATALLHAGQVAAAAELATTAERLTDVASVKAGLTAIRANLEFETAGPRPAGRMLVDAAEQADPGDAPAMLRNGATFAWLAADAETLARADELLVPADPVVRGMARLLAGDPHTGITLLTGVVEASSAASLPGTAARDQAVQTIMAAQIVGDDRRALELATAETAHCRREGLVGALPTALRMLGGAQLAFGQHQDAEATATEALGLDTDLGGPPCGGWQNIVLGTIAAIEGDEERLRTVLEGATTPCTEFAARMLALLDLGLGRYDSALRRLEEADPAAPHHSVDAMLAAADHVEAAVRAGRGDRARDVADRVAEWSTIVGRPWMRAVALRCRALLDDDCDLLGQAVALHEADAQARPFQRARTELIHGEWLRRARRRADARGPLRSALDTFERLRAAPWTERARGELRAAGEQGARSDAVAPDLLDRLTPQELQVVRMAAEGTSSREIAAQLFLSPRTVEYHLYKAYPKLGVASRRELSRLELVPS